jgi:hypothetical protein
LRLRSIDLFGIAVIFTPDGGERLFMKQQIYTCRVCHTRISGNRKVCFSCETDQREASDRCYCDCHYHPIYREPCAVCGHRQAEGKFIGGAISGYWLANS